MHSTPASLTDSALTEAIGRMAADHRRTTVALVIHLAEFEARDLHLAAGYPSLFAYCTKVLRLSEHEAYHRIKASRDARRFPALLDRLASGSLTLTNLRILSPHLTPEGHLALLDRAAGKSKRQVDTMLARMFPKPDVPASVRKLPERPRSDGSEGAGVASAPAPANRPEAMALELAGSSGAVRASVATVAAPIPPVSTVPTGASPARRTTVAPLSATRYEVRFTASEATRVKLERARDLLRHAIPSGDLAEVFDRALTSLVRDLERRKYGAADRPRPVQGPAAESPQGPTGPSRHVPAAVRRMVVARDGQRCTFRSPAGKRCDATAFLEFHHREPYAAGGAMTAANIELRCGPHNRHAAKLYFDAIRRDRTLYETGT